MIFTKQHCLSHVTCNICVAEKQKANIKNINGHIVTWPVESSKWIQDMFCSVDLVFFAAVDRISHKKFILSTFNAGPEKDCPGFELWAWPRPKKGPAFLCACLRNIYCVGRCLHFHFQQLRFSNYLIKANDSGHAICRTENVAHNEYTNVL